MRKWEYKVVRLERELKAAEEQLNKLGDIGWQLVSVWAKDGEDTRVAVPMRPAPGLPQCSRSRACLQAR